MYNIGSGAGRVGSKGSAFFLFQAEDGIRYELVTGVQTCALPISASAYAGEVTLETLGGLTARVALRAAAVERLPVPMPRARVPLLVGLLALTAALVVIAVLQLRRESELSRLRVDFTSSVSHELRTPL